MGTRALRHCRVAQRNLLGQWFWRNTAAYGVKGKAGPKSQRLPCGPASHLSCAPKSGEPQSSSSLSGWHTGCGGHRPWATQCGHPGRATAIANVTNVHEALLSPPPSSIQQRQALVAPGKGPVGFLPWCSLVGAQLRSDGVDGMRCMRTCMRTDSGQGTHGA